jgi:superfamily II DNA helicase RecQ
MQSPSNLQEAEGNDQNTIELQGEIPTSRYHTTDWKQWDEEHKGQTKPTSTHRQHRFPDKSWTVRRVKEKFGQTLRAGQWEALKILIFRLIDVIVVAKTGFGKSLLYNAAPFLTSDPNENGICFVLMPLKSIEATQKDALELQFSSSGATVCIVNGENNCRALRKECGKGIYTHSMYNIFNDHLETDAVVVFSSPEIAVTKEFNDDVLQNSEFRRRLILFAVDELHLIHEWSDFRPEYANIKVVRNRLPREVPMLGVSATLPPETLDIAKRFGGFKFDSVDVQKSSIDRPEISITMLESEEKSQKGFEKFNDLRRIFPRGVTHRIEIPKTLIFMKSKRKIHTAYRIIREEWLPELGYPKEARSWIKIFHADVPEEDLIELRKEFERPDKHDDRDHCSKYRVLICTDSYGMGVDNPDICNICDGLMLD